MNRKAFALAGLAIGIGGVLLALGRMKQGLSEQILDESIPSENDVEFELDLSELDEIPAGSVNDKRLDWTGNASQAEVVNERVNVRPINGNNGYYNRGNR